MWIAFEVRIDLKVGSWRKVKRRIENRKIEVIAKTRPYYSPVL